MRKVLVVLAALYGTASADGDKGREVPIDGGARVRIGTTDDGRPSVQLCDAETCRPMSVGSGEVTLLGIVDLEGTPRELSGGGIAYRLERSGMKRPAIFIRTTERQRVTDGMKGGGEVTGDHVRSTLVMYTLANEHLLYVSVENISPSGRGTTSTVSLARPASGRVLDIVVVEQRHLEHRSHCLQPKPVTTRYRFVDGQYHQGDTVHPHGGC